MRAVVARVTRAAVRVDGETVGEIGTGLLVLLGVHRDDPARENPAEAVAVMARKLHELRILDGERMEVEDVREDAELLGRRRREVDPHHDAVRRIEPRRLDSRDAFGDAVAVDEDGDHG